MQKYEKRDDLTFIEIFTHHRDEIERLWRC